MTHRTEPFFPCDSRNWTLLSNMTHSNWTSSLLHDSKNWTLFWIWLKELKIFMIFLTQRIDFFEYDSKNWTFFSWMWLTELNFFRIWLKELNFLLNMTQRIELFVEHDSNNWLSSFFRMTKILLNTTQRIEPFLKYVPKNRTFFFLKICSKNFFQYDSQNWTHFFSITYRIEHLRVWLKELNSQNDANFLFFGFDSKNYFHMTLRIIFHMTLRIIFSYDSKYWPFF